MTQQPEAVENYIQQALTTERQQWNRLTTAYEDLRTAHYCRYWLELSEAGVHELWREIDARDKRIADLIDENNQLKADLSAR